MRGLAKTGLVILLSLLMTLRVVAHPIVLSAPEPGLIALCSNGEIVYFSLETGQPVEKSEKKSDTACPYSGLSAISTTPSSGPLLLGLSVSLDISTNVSDQFRAVTRAHIHAARAPPILF